MAYTGRLAPGMEKRLNRHAGTILIGGIFMCFSVMLFLSFCDMQCDDHTYGMNHDKFEVSKGQSWKKRIFAAIRPYSAFLVVLILTGPKNVDRRDAIRETWLKDVPKNVNVKFVVGLKNLNVVDTDKVQREHLANNDMLLLEEIGDAYHGLTVKLMESFQWVDKNIDFQYLLKADDDSFVRLDKILTDLRSRPKEKLYWGFFNGNAHVKHSGPWEEKNWILCDRYLPYARGGGYLLSADLVHYVAANAKYFQKFSSEDVSLGAWLGPLDIQRVHDPRFDTEYRSRGCDNRYIVLHKQSIADMKEKADNLVQLGHLCKEEVKLFRSYKYNWNVPPSLCCVRNDSSIP